MPWSAKEIFIPPSCPGCSCDTREGSTWPVEGIAAYRTMHQGVVLKSERHLNRRGGRPFELQILEALHCITAHRYPDR